MRKTAYAFLFLCAAAIESYGQGQPTLIGSRTEITTPGRYMLNRDLVQNGSAPVITIRSNNVTLDLAGYEIAGPGNNTGTGIMVDGASGVRIMNGYVRDLGFGITVNNSNAVTIEGMHIVGRDIAVPAPPPEVAIMIINSQSVVVKHNDLYRIGLGVFVRGPMSMGNHIYENTLTAGMNGLLGVCFNPAPSGAAGGPRGNTVERNSITNFNYAIQANAGGPQVIKNNTMFYKVGAFDMKEGTVLQDIDNTKTSLQ